MSNIKRVTIRGEVPYNTNEYPDINNFLGQMNSPSIGLRIRYTGHAPLRPSKYGGKTAFFHFEISGEEAVPVPWIDNLMKAIVGCGGVISCAEVFDIECSSRPVRLSLEIPQTPANLIEAGG